MEKLTRKSAIDIIMSDPNFNYIGIENGVKVFELKAEPKCSRCGKADKRCDCEDSCIDFE